MEFRVLIVAPFGRDADVIADVLAFDDRDCFACADSVCLTAELDRGAGTAIVTEESLKSDNGEVLAAWIDRQPAWSDFPIILLSGRATERRSAASIDMLERLGNVLVLERPLNSETLRRAVMSSLRARARQYDARRHLAESEQHLIARSKAQEALERLNDSLESRIAERTQELASANNRLMREIHERAKVQAVLVQSQKMEALGQLTGGIAHDFNNLLNVIMANAELIARISSDERVRKMAATTKRATERGAKLTAQLLTFSRTSNLDLKAVNVASLLQGMRDIISISLGSSIAFTTTSDSEDLWTQADANQLELAVLNLTINARDAMPGGGRLTIHAGERPAPDETFTAGRYVVIRVSDSGSGIEPGVLSRVFDPFFTTKPVGKGTGLGLSQVYGIARQAGGVARIESEPGKGTSVEIWLPLGAKDLQEADVALKPEDSASGAKRILVVEDDEDVREMLVECLQTLGYSVTHACDGPNGLKRLPLDHPDLMMVDFAMPGMNGMEVIAKARELRADLPVILATGYADVDVSKIKEKRFAALRKPFQLDELARTVRIALDN
ncbi:response regulator [Caballeronia sp. LP006]|uniref:response regulator n=1 Tax=unclassified Caballeronia TaxID=2646786 RepID=UPI0020294EB8|nr:MULTISPECIES: response regulator [unclassified Caballeronia]MDR5775446.1 response regulator [Caballeronia sp. LZ002]MDR5828769.1 response regulator [Caballeronia sp. LP006]MDR5850884.1 response regulator [Caballeronia sp. LZ003]